MTVALDLGTHASRSLRVVGTGLVARQSRTIAALLRDGELARDWLKRLQLPCIASEEHLLLPGDSADQLRQLFRVPVQELLTDGLVPYDDPVTRQLLSLLVDGLVPLSSSPNELCCFTHPGDQPAQGAEESPELARRRQFVSRILHLRGYEPRAINPALALVLAEMEPEHFTGLGICLGASGIDVVVAHRGNCAAAARLGRGGRWIDEELARAAGWQMDDAFGQRVLDVETARQIKERSSLAAPADDSERLVAELYRGLTMELAELVQRLLDSQPLLTRFAKPLAIVCGGGPSRARGFVEYLSREIERRLPGSLAGAVRLERPGDYNVARGCLIAATLEGELRRTTMRLSA